jgi:hypothetical protein
VLCVCVCVCGGGGVVSSYLTFQADAGALERLQLSWQYPGEFGQFHFEPDDKGRRRGDRFAPAIAVPRRHPELVFCSRLQVERIESVGGRNPHLSGTALNNKFVWSQPRQLTRYTDCLTAGAKTNCRSCKASTPAPGRTCTVQWEWGRLQGVKFTAYPVKCGGYERMEPYLHAVLCVHEMHKDRQAALNRDEGLESRCGHFAPRKTVTVRVT